MKRHYLFTPFLFVLAYLLNTYYWISTAVAPHELLRPIITLWIIVGLLLFPARWLTGSWKIASFVLVVFVFCFYYSQRFFEVMEIMALAVIVLWSAYARL